MYFFYYIPIGIDAETRRFPVMTVFFAVTCTVVFVLARYFPGETPFEFSNFVYQPGVTGWSSAIASAFLHVSYLHLIGNMVYLLLFGWYLEDRLGTISYTVLFLGATLAGNLSQGWYNEHVLHIYVGIVGASGAISGVLGAFLVRLYINRVKIAYWVFLPLLAYNRAGRVDVPVVFALVLWVMFEVTRGLVQFGGASAGVAYVTHVVGFAFGVSYILAGGGWKEARAEACRVRAQRHLKRGEFVGAQDELSRYATFRPNDGRARAELARAQVQTGDAISAKASYLKACELLLRAQERGECEDVYEQAVRGYPDFTLTVEPQLDLAFGLERNLKHELALKAYRNFARRYPRHKEAPFALLRAANLCYNSFADRSGARELYGALVERYPEDVWVDFAREQARLLA